jgi:hypothetical protein
MGDLEINCNPSAFSESALDGDDRSYENDTGQPAVLAGSTRFRVVEIEVFEVCDRDPDGSAVRT